MAKEYFQGDRNPGRTTDERGSIRQAILLVILLLTASLGYVYFFTGLIKPRENVFTPPPPQVAPVKQPIPPRPTLEAGGEATPATQPEGVKPPPATVEKAAPAKVEQKVAPSPAAKPADTTTAKPAPASTLKPAATTATKPAAAPAPKPAPTVAQKSAVPAAPKPAATPAQKAVAGPAPKQPAAAAPKQTVKAAKGEEKPATKKETKTPAVAPATTAKTAMKTTAAAPSKETSKGTKSTATKEVVVPSAAKKGYALAIGDTATAGEAEKLRGRLNKLGITNVTVKTIRKTETMHRLSLGEFSDSSAAGAELGRLKPLASGAFILKENGRYALYAGSYLQAARAESEAKRLSAKGFKAEIKDAKVGVQVHQVMAGSFAGNDEATKAAEKLKKNGISAEVVKLGQ